MRCDSDGGRPDGQLDRRHVSWRSSRWLPDVPVLQLRRTLWPLVWPLLLASGVWHLQLANAADDSRTDLPRQSPLLSVHQPGSVAKQGLARNLEHIPYVDLAADQPVELGCDGDQPIQWLYPLLQLVCSVASEV